MPLALASNGFDFEIDWQRLKDTMSAKTRLIICNFPHNPTGALLSAAGLDQLASVVRYSNTFLLSDEVYEHIIFDGNQHHSLLSHHER